MSAVLIEARPTVAFVAEDDEARRELGREIKRRRESHGMSPGELAELAGIASRGTIYAVEKGKSRGLTQQKVLKALEQWESEYATTSRGELMTDSSPGGAPGLVTFRLQGNFGVDVTVQGPVANMPELEQQVERLLSRMQEQPGDRP